MRNPRTRNLIGSVLTATIAVCMALATMPEMRCSGGNCKKATGQHCFDGTRYLVGYTFVLTYDG